MTTAYPEPTVSIILPVYNGERYLNEAVESILAQTYPSWELIIVDDCSTDGTPEICQSYVKKDDRIRYVRNETNKKLPASLNVGFSHARGQYLTWISDDNRFREDALEVMAGALDRDSQIDLVYCRIQQIDEKAISSILRQRPNIALSCTARISCLPVFSTAAKCRKPSAATTKRCFLWKITISGFAPIGSFPSST